MSAAALLGPPQTKGHRAPTSYLYAFVQTDDTDPRSPRELCHPTVLRQVWNPKISHQSPSSCEVTKIFSFFMFPKHVDHFRKERTIPDRT